MTQVNFFQRKNKPPEKWERGRFVALLPVGKETEDSPTLWKAASSSSLSRACGWSPADSTITRLVFWELSSPCSGGSSGSCMMGESPCSLDVGVWRYGLSSSGGVLISSGVLLGESDTAVAFWVSDTSVPGVVTLKWKSQVIPWQHTHFSCWSKGIRRKNGIYLHGPGKSK